MPKQKRYDFKRLQGTSSGKQEPPAREVNIGSVNQRLGELRLADPAAAARKKRDIADAVGQPNVPPAIANILGVPENAPPRARPGVRIRDRTRIPGPAPPKSWLRGDRHGWTSNNATQTPKKGMKGDVERRTPEQLLRFAKMSGWDQSSSTTSLSHYCLKQLATHWNLLDEVDYHTLSVLPPMVRTRLLSYLSFYGPAISIEAVKALMLNDTAMLDLAGLIGHDTLTLSRLKSALTSVAARELEPESWDDAISITAPSSILATSAFSTLTHLCLSHPPPTVRWQDLLTLTKHTPAVTHLSLAFWPWPTLTPNLATTTVTGQHGPTVAAGGSGFYSEFDKDLAEPRALLRQLSHNLLQLQWLDIDGSKSWLLALAHPNGKHFEDAALLPVPAADVADELTSSWRNLTHVRCDSPYLSDAPWRQRRPGQGASTSQAVIERMPTYRNLAQYIGTKDLSAVKSRFADWCSAEMAALAAVQCINDFRKKQGCSAIVVDLGWNYV